MIISGSPSVKYRCITFHRGRFAGSRLKSKAQLARSITTKHEQPAIFCKHQNHYKDQTAESYTDALYMDENMHKT